MVCAITALLPGSFVSASGAIQPRGPALDSQLLIPLPLTQPEASKPTLPPKKVEAAQPQPTNAVLLPDQNPAAQTPLPEFNKQIIITLADQDLKYYQDTNLLGEFKISSGLPGTPTPPGEYTVLKKIPVVDYKGPNYDFRNTKWNLLFKKGNPLGYYIHGAYWHHNFGHPMSHGCVNVSYADMEGLYNWADVGTKVLIQ